LEEPIDASAKSFNSLFVDCQVNYFQRKILKIMVEAAGVEPASENAVNREPSCFFLFVFVSSPELRTDEDGPATSLISLAVGVQAEHLQPAYCATFRTSP
jgi:hypothetical protein